MYYHKAGFAFGESLATHARRRFRLCPPSVHNPNAPQVDPSLWIVHYGPIENNERIPAQMIPRDNRTQQILETRAYLQRCGQIQRKEFILGDRVNWPQIAYPREANRQAMYAGNRGVPQAIAYPPQPPAGPPNKRARTAQGGHGQMQPGMGPMAAPDANVYDDDEDTSRGDFFDHLTPRDVSAHRYQQNHEWMEEILSSPYRIGQLGFASLGFGLKGELSGLTDGIFEAPGGDITKRLAGKTDKTHLDAELAAEFRKRVNERVETTNDEIARMKAAHEKKMAQFRKNSLLTTAEKDLRSAVDGAGFGVFPPERGQEDQEAVSPRLTTKHPKKVDDIVAQVEASLGQTAEVIYNLKRIQDGGYQEPAPEPISPPAAIPSIAQPDAATGGSGSMSRQLSQAESQHSGISMDDSDVDMGGTAAGLLDQMHPGLSSTSTPANNYPTPQGQLSAIQSTVLTPASLNGPSPQPSAAAAARRPSSQPRPSEDTAMSGTDAQRQPSGLTAPDQGTESGEWVVVPAGGVTPDPSTTITTATANDNNDHNDNNDKDDEDNEDDDKDDDNNDSSNNNGRQSTIYPDSVAEQNSKPPSLPASQPTSRQISAAATPAAGSMDFSADDNDFGSLGDLDTAGEALASFHDTPGDLGGDFMEDSAFGDAFHGVEASGHDTGTPGDGNL
jgi:hypothetical protein